MLSAENSPENPTLVENLVAELRTWAGGVVAGCAHSTHARAPLRANARSIAHSRCMALPPVSDKSSIHRSACCVPLI
jgi:hypothetical protein